MKTKYEQLVGLLEEMFQFDNEDLDFGIYRIMNQKREEIRKFLHQDLLPQVKQAFEKYQSVDQVNIRKELEQLKKNLQDAGVEPETSPKYKALQEQLTQSVDLNALENEVYSHLVTFFSRYYDNGDFISKRKYKKDVYAIPYEGEEVKLYWVNADQYYVKTSEYFRDYSFKLPSGRKVHFVLTEASTEQNNNKEQEGKERRFILCEEAPVCEEQGELYIRFIYREDKEKQSVLNQQAVEKVFQSEGCSDWLLELRTPAPTEKNRNRTLLEKHLNDYTSRNTFDYFIHKDLGGFLRRELDFYIKNEIMHLDDLDTENEARIEQYLSKIKVVKSIGHKIIKFLEQIENFQKKLWLKKKFIIETNYCVTIDRIPEELYPEILKNQEQIDEWKRLFNINEIEGYSEPLSLDFLKNNPYLILDTKFFVKPFLDKFLMSIEDIDEQISGLLIKSENFQALNLIRERYQRQVKSVYLDPPYNTSEENFVYKNEYKHSSWLSMIGDRVLLLQQLLTNDGILQIAIDDEELYRLKLLMDGLWGSNRYIGTVVVQSNPRGRGINSYFATSHEYFLCFALNPDKASIVDMPLTEEQEGEYRHVDETSPYRLLPFRRSGGLSTPDERPNSEFTLFFSPSHERIIAVGGERLKDYPSPYEPSCVYALFNTNGEVEQLSVDEFLRKAPKDVVSILPIDSDGRRRVWRWSDRVKILEAAKDGEFVVQGSSGNYTVQLKDRIKEGRKPKTIWIDSKYDASSHGTNLLQEMLGERRVFGYPKSLYSTKDSIYCVVGKDKHAIVLDVFGGSGTTGHAVIELNREDKGHRKCILAEMGEYFDTVLKSRILKAVYSREWRDGKPVSRDGISQMIKVIHLESYEDTINNLHISQTEQQQLALELMPKETREEYLLSYMLDIETEDSASLLNLEAFENPFDYKLRISNGTETTLKTVDVVETFNYLLGLTVRQIEVIQGFKVIKGELPTGERALIIWRNLKEKSNEELEKFFAKSKYNTRDNEFDYIYVNGDNHLENIKLQEDMWKVKLIEEEFKRLMFDVQDV